jgi:hypothetical protein
MEELKNEQVPKNFWQFAWLFNSKKEPAPPPPARKPEETDSADESKLARIKEELYEG